MMTTICDEASGFWELSIHQFHINLTRLLLPFLACIVLLDSQPISTSPLKYSDTLPSFPSTGRYYTRPTLYLRSLHLSTNVEQPTSSMNPSRMLAKSACNIVLACLLASARVLNLQVFHSIQFNFIPLYFFISCLSLLWLRLITQ